VCKKSIKNSQPFVKKIDKMSWPQGGGISLTHTVHQPVPLMFFSRPPPDPTQSTDNFITDPLSDIWQHRSQQCLHLRQVRLATLSAVLAGNTCLIVLGNLQSNIKSISRFSTVKEKPVRHYSRTKVHCTRWRTCSSFCSTSRCRWRLYNIWRVYHGL